jgi:hypothetical protein
MISPVSSNNEISSGAISQAKPQPVKQGASSPQDTVHVSSQALAGGGDVDHDGDSH